jgi:MOSC domain-containing protein YiiM
MSESRFKLPQRGVVDWIGLRPARGAPMNVVEHADASAGRGLLGDYVAMRGSHKRQVTLMQAEHLYVLGLFLHRLEEVEPEHLRRNVLVRGINLLAFIGQKFHVGQTVLLGTGVCDPCVHMERTLGAGAFHAMQGHSGITASILIGGPIRRGDAVSLAARMPTASSEEGPRLRYFAQRRTDPI